MLKLRRDIIAAVIARRLRAIIPDADEIREVAKDHTLSDATCREIAMKIEQRTERLAIQLLRSTRY